MLYAHSLSQHYASQAPPDRRTEAIVLNRSRIDRSILVRVLKSNAYEKDTYVTFADAHYGGMFEDISLTEGLSEGDKVLISHWDEEDENGQVATYQIEVLETQKETTSQ